MVFLRFISQTLSWECLISKSRGVAMSWSVDPISIKNQWNGPAWYLVKRKSDKDYYKLNYDPRPENWYTCWYKRVEVYCWSWQLNASWFWWTIFTRMGKDSFARSTVAYQIQRDVLPSLEAQIIKKLPASAGDLSSIPGSGRCPGGGNGNPLQYSCLGNLLDRGAWWATVHGVTKEWYTTLQWNNNSKTCSNNETTADTATRVGVTAWLSWRLSIVSSFVSIHLLRRPNRWVEWWYCGSQHSCILWVFDDSTNLCSSFRYVVLL